MDPQALWIAAAGGLVAFLIGLATGRGAGRGAIRRARELEDRLIAAEDEMTRYRTQVSEHFAETSKLLHDLTLQYRNVYEHLADGARTLCPGGAALLAPSLAEAALPAASEAPAAEAEPEPDDQLDLELGGPDRATPPTPRRESDALGPLLEENEPGWSQATLEQRTH